jgi:hypothetical protein
VSGVRPVAGRLRSPLVLAIGLASAACLSSPSDVRVPLGRDFTLAVGQSVLVGTTGLRISVAGVASDSRCPTSVQCVWEGDATVAVAVTDASTGPASYALHTSDRFPREAMHQSYKVSLVRLDPVPSSPTHLALSDYRVTLVVAR